MSAMLALSSQVGAIQPSPASVLRRRARELRAAGRDVIELSSGNLDFPTPDHVIAAAHQAGSRGETRYTDVDGTPELKAAVRAALSRNHFLDYAPDEIIISTGSTQALFNALFATLAPGDEVIIAAPYWAPYLDQVRLLGGIPVVVPCAQNNGFKLRPEDLEAAITPRTRWLILNNPVNPSGTLYRRDDLAAIAAVLDRHPGIWILSDGLYEQIVFDAECALTLAEIAPGLKSRTLTVSGVAKSYSMMGWRIGYAAGPAALIQAMINIQSQTTSGASSIGQAAAVAALNGPQDLLRQRASILRDRRDRFTALVNDCDGLACTAPEATFYLLVSCAGVIGRRTPDGKEIAGDRDFAAYLLQSADLAVMPGEDFGMSPAIRVSFANPLPLIAEAGRRLKKACEALR